MKLNKNSYSVNNPNSSNKSTKASNSRCSSLSILLKNRILFIIYLLKSAFLPSLDSKTKSSLLKPHKVKKEKIINGHFKSSLLLFLTIFSQLSSLTQAYGQTGCLIDETLCETYEYCQNDGFIGYCEILEDEFTLKKSLRSESPIELNIDSPIRIHKYNYESDDSENDVQQESPDYSDYLNRNNHDEDDDGKEDIVNEDYDNDENISKRSYEAIDDAIGYNAQLRSELSDIISKLNELEEDLDNDDNDEDQLNNSKMFIIENDEDRENSNIYKRYSEGDDYDDLLINNKDYDQQESYENGDQNESYDENGNFEDNVDDTQTYFFLTPKTLNKRLAINYIPYEEKQPLKSYYNYENEPNSIGQLLKNLENIEKKLKKEDLKNEIRIRELKEKLYDLKFNFPVTSEEDYQDDGTESTSQQEVIDPIEIVINKQNSYDENEPSNNLDYNDSTDVNKDILLQPILVDNRNTKKIGEDVEDNLAKLEQRLMNDEENFMRKITKTNEFMDRESFRALEKPMSADSLPIVKDQSTEKIEFVDSTFVFIELDKRLTDLDAENLLSYISTLTSIPKDSFDDISISNNLLLFKVNDAHLNSTYFVNTILKNQYKILNEKGLKIISCGLGKDSHRVQLHKHPLNIDSNSRLFPLIALILCISIGCILVILFSVFIIKRRAYLRDKLVNDVSSMVKKPKPFDDEESLIRTQKQSTFRSWFSFARRSQTSPEKDMTPTQDYSELCRQRMQTKSNKSTPLNSTACTTMSQINDTTTPGLASPSMMNANAINSTPIRITSVGSNDLKGSDSTRSSTSSCLSRVVANKRMGEEPLSPFNMDITTGHVILSYMEEHLNDKNRLTKDWEELNDYEPEINKTEIASLPQNMTKNRYSNVLPYDHNRVKIGENLESDYINASFITDDDPKNPAYIATQGPLINTTNDFWKMVWEQRSVVIVSLCRTVEYGSLKCNQFWPANGCEIYDQYEVHLVSEHVWCDDYVVRNFFLKNLETNQTRTVTQFHFLTWPENGIPQNTKSILDFRRKVNKSYKSKSCPIIVHCNDGLGRTGTYIMIDMVLNKIIRGAKEIDLAATLEYLRDQRAGMVKNKNQFEYSFGVVTEEVQNMLKALTQ